MEKADKPKKSKRSPWYVARVYWLPAVLWMGIIFLFSSRRSVTVSPEYIWNFLFFKTLHLIEYAILFTLFARALYQQGAGPQKTTVFRTAFLLTILYAISDEIHQQFVPSREGRPRDVIIDGIGAMSIWFYLSTQLPKAPPKLKAWAKNLGLPF